MNHIWGCIQYNQPKQCLILCVVQIDHQIFYHFNLVFLTALTEHESICYNTRKHRWMICNRLFLLCSFTAFPLATPTTSQHKQNEKRVILTLALWQSHRPWGKTSHYKASNTTVLFLHSKDKVIVFFNKKKGRQFPFKTCLKPAYIFQDTINEYQLFTVDA